MKYVSSSILWVVGFVASSVFFGGSEHESEVVQYNLLWQKGENL